jgi:hypothetical protein
VQFDQAERHDDMKAAHGDGDVQTIVARYMAAPSKSMTYLLALALYSDLHPGDAAVTRLIQQAPVKVKHMQIAREMVNTCLQMRRRLWFDTYAMSCRRGAILEAITEQLCRQRSASVDTEQHVGPLPNPPHRKGRSRPMDVLVKEALLEVYEAKSNLADLKQDDLAEMDAIEVAALDEGQPVRLAIASFALQDDMRDDLEDVSFTCDLRIACRQDIDLLKDRPADTSAQHPAAA